MSMRIAILGTRGIPASYSGFETSVEETASRLVERGHEVTVYCRTSYVETPESQYRGAQLVKLPSIQSKHLDTPSHTTLSVFHMLTRHYRPDVIQMYGVGNSLWLLPLRLKRCPIVSVVDGLDWKRKKWGRFASAFLRTSERFAVWWADEYVVDSHVVADYYRARFRRPPIYIPYGANIPKKALADSQVRGFGLEPGKYILFVGRLVPEKGVHHLIHAFESVQTDIPLAIVGDNIYDLDYVKLLKSTKDPRVRFLGFVYGEGYRQLNSHAYVYVQPSELEGTSPALLGAMGFGNCVLVSDIPENRETIGDAGLTFRCGDNRDLASRLQELVDHPDTVRRFKELARDRVAQYYDWDKITDEYERLFYQLLNRPLPPRLQCPG
jgi:glycosyltransferase involved in cell wall biosynthesis